MFRLVAGNEENVTVCDSEYCELDSWYETIVLWSEWLEERCEEAEGIYDIKYAIEVYKLKHGLMEESELVPGWREYDHDMDELGLIQWAQSVLEDVGLTCTLLDN